MKFGLYVGSRAGATCAGPADPLRIGRLVNELSGGHPFVIREYVHWCGGNTALEQEIDASGDLLTTDHARRLYVAWGGRELDLVLSYLPPVADLDGWLAFIDRALDGTATWRDTCRLPLRRTSPSHASTAARPA